MLKTFYSSVFEFLVLKGTFHFVLFFIFKIFLFHKTCGVGLNMVPWINMANFKILP
jgi:hypothetical protein